MKLTPNAITLIKDKRIRTRLALALDVTDQAICKYIKRNDDNLTKAAALMVIREETGLDDSEILEEERCKAA
jgi:hypothetical protein